MGDRLTPLQHAYLKAMGIEVWVKRSIAFSESPNVEATSPVESASMPSQDSIKYPGHMGWEELRRAVAACVRCELHRGRTQTVFGVGNIHAGWFIVGEAPGVEEDRQGEPFVGRAGQLLNAMLKAIGLEREEVFIANILKCRPPDNRDPRPQEAACCEPFLRRQIELVRPKIILAVGRIAAQNLLKCNTPIGQMRGRVHYYQDTHIPIVATYHPAYLLRSPKEKRKAWQDLLFAKKVFSGAC